jgi:hypothetical protein
MLTERQKQNDQSLTPVSTSRLIRKEETEVRELRQEFDRRVEHEVDIGFKSYVLAAERVLRSDPRNMAMAYADATDQAGLAQRVGEVMAAGKKAATAAKISLLDAVMRILQSEREVAQKIGGDWLDRQARIEINNLNLGGNISRSYPVALRLSPAQRFPKWRRWRIPAP